MPPALGTLLTALCESLRSLHVMCLCVCRICRSHKNAVAWCSNACMEPSMPHQIHTYLVSCLIRFGCLVHVKALPRQLDPSSSVVLITVHSQSQPADGMESVTRWLSETTKRQRHGKQICSLRAKGISQTAVGGRGWCSWCS